MVFDQLNSRSGFIPRLSYQDMIIEVPQGGLRASVYGEDRVRDAVLADVGQMGDLEVSGVKREVDYRYSIENLRQVMHTYVYENDQRGIDGFLFTLKHPVINILGPLVARSDVIAIAMLGQGIKRFWGIPELFVVPVSNRKIVEQLYDWKAVTIETHLKQVWREFPEYRCVSMPSYLPET